MQHILWRDYGIPADFSWLDAIRAVRLDSAERQRAQGRQIDGR